MRRDDYGKKELITLFRGIFLIQGLILFYIAVLLATSFSPIRSDFSEGLWRGLPLILLFGPWIIEYLLWNSQKMPLFVILSWCLVSGLYGVMYHDFSLENLDYELGFGYWITSLALTIPILFCLFVILVHRILKIWKFGLVHPSVYRGD